MVVACRLRAVALPDLLPGESCSQLRLFQVVGRQRSSNDFALSHAIHVLCGGRAVEPDVSHDRTFLDAYAIAVQASEFKHAFRTPALGRRLYPSCGLAEILQDTDTGSGHAPEQNHCLGVAILRSQLQPVIRFLGSRWTAGRLLQQSFAKLELSLCIASLGGLYDRRIGGRQRRLS